MVKTFAYILLVAIATLILGACLVIAAPGCKSALPSIAAPSKQTPQLKKFYDQEIKAGVPADQALTQTIDKALEKKNTSASGQVANYQEDLRHYAAYALLASLVLGIAGVLFQSPKLSLAGVVAGGGLFVLCVVLGILLSFWKWIILAIVAVPAIYLAIRIKKYGWAAVWHKIEVNITHAAAAEWPDQPYFSDGPGALSLNNTATVDGGSTYTYDQAKRACVDSLHTAAAVASGATK